MQAHHFTSWITYQPDPSSVAEEQRVVAARLRTVVKAKGAERAALRGAGCALADLRAGYLTVV